MHQTNAWDGSSSIAAAVLLSNQVSSSRQLEQEVSHESPFGRALFVHVGNKRLTFSHFPTH